MDERTTRLTDLAGFTAWCDRAPGVGVCFAGKGPKLPVEGIVRRLVPDREPAWLRQVHGSAVHDARAGCAGDGDALVARDRRHVLAVVTADCVPVLLAAPRVIAAVHAGWRGIVAGVVGAAFERLDVGASAVTAWIGPAIGSCCYEVGDDVATRVVDASDAAVARPGPRGRPHLDLTAAVAVQLARLGVEDVRRVELCTRCHPERLYSYRRDGKKAGRNVAMIWRVG